MKPKSRISSDFSRLSRRNEMVREEIAVRKRREKATFCD